MKNTLITLAGAAAVFLAVAQTSNANQITGNIGFTGLAQLNTTSVGTSTYVVNWFNTVVNATSGDFTSVALNTTSDVSIKSPWFFNTLSAVPAFWWAGTSPKFTFDLSSSSVSSNDGTFLNVILVGSVSAVGFETTAFTGTFQVANPAANGVANFTERLSFNSINGVPDGGTTVMLLGAAFSGLALIKRKFMA